MYIQDAHYLFLVRVSLISLCSCPTSSSSPYQLLNSSLLLIHLSPRSLIHYWTDLFYTIPVPFTVSFVIWLYTPVDFDLLLPMVLGIFIDFS